MRVRPLLAACPAVFLVLSAGLTPKATHGADKNAKTDPTAKALAEANEHKLNGEYEKFLEVLQGVADKLPAVVPSEHDYGPYTHVVLNSRGAKLDAVTFKMPGKSGDWAMSWEYVYPARSRGASWYIGARRGLLRDAGFRTFSQTLDYVEDGAGADLPRRNVRVGQDLVGRLQAGEEYMLWFVFEHREPVDFHIRIYARDYEK